MSKTDLGKHGEDIAARYLLKHGYKIIDRNFRIRGGEIDIVAIEKNTLVVVEVKTRTSLPPGERIDVVTVDFTDTEQPKINLIKNASF
ncbi:YraN family protein [Candidatus Curtissbacteria bacterium]|nr:YraN family protein [Candidatus Curtissbacteria bacterium]